MFVFKKSQFSLLCACALVAVPACSDDGGGAADETGTGTGTGTGEDAEETGDDMPPTTGDEEDTGPSEDTGPAESTGAESTGGEPDCAEITVEELIGDNIGVPAVVTDTISVGDESLPDLFQIEFYAPDETGSFDLSMAPDDNYSTCNNCIRLFEDNSMGASARQYFQSEGTLEIDESTPPVSLEPTLTFSGVRLIEVTIAPMTFVSTPVEGGQCIDIVDGTVTAVDLVEVCDNEMDDDANNLIDCGDPGCAEDTACTDLCEMAETAAVGENAGDTTDGTNAFESICNDFGGLEDLWTYTPAEAGPTIVTLTSETNQGIAVREACADITSQLACAEAVEGGEEEEVTFFAADATDYTIIVDGAAADEEGPYTLNITVPVLTPEIDVDPADNDTFETANPLISDGFIGTIEEGGEDWFSVTIPDGETTIRATTFGQVAACDGDTTLTIFEDDGTTQLAQDEDGGPGTCSAVEATGLTAGDTYLIQLIAADDTETFDYSLLIETE